MAALVGRYKDRLLGVLSCFDWMVVTGTLLGRLYCNGHGWLGTSSRPMISLPGLRTRPSCSGVISLLLSARPMASSPSNCTACSIVT